MKSHLLTTILASIAVGCGGDWVETEMCAQVEDDAETCPAADDVDVSQMTNFEWCAADVKEVSGDGELTDSPFDEESAFCCYAAVAQDADPSCIVGRPLVDGDDTCLADVRGLAPDAPPDADRDAWIAAARAEHASVAAFARVTLQLMALGAPPELLAKVQQAAAEEVQHAQACLGVASRLAGTPLSFGPLSLPTEALATDAVSVAVAAVREGCLGETLGAWMAQQCAGQAADPAATAVLTRIADDEARHAALSWQIVAWLLPRQGVRAAVIEALQAPFEVSAPHLGLGTARPQDGAAQLNAWIAEATRTVLVPAARALLAA